MDARIGRRARISSRDRQEDTGYTRIGNDASNWYDSQPSGPEMVSGAASNNACLGGIVVDIMWNRQRTVIAGVATCSLLTAFLAAPLLAVQDRAAQAPAANAAEEAEKERELNIRYAQSYLKLVEATLERFEETNRRVPNSIRRGVMQAVEDAVREARVRVQLAESGGERDAEVYVSSAEDLLRRAQAALSKANAVNARVASTVSPSEVNRLKAELELAQVRVDKARHLAAESPLSNVRYELGQLREDVQQLHLNVALLRDRN